MSKKITCSVTGNIYYVTDKRYAYIVARYGSEEAVANKYTSLVGRKIRDGQIDYPPNGFKNRIQCTVTGKWCYISNERINKGIEKYGSLEAFRLQYISRPAKQKLKEKRNAMAN